eukprot:scaffold4429_cov81-Skeletonema_dohrnii-CCMP3373.AAC.15
MRCNGGYSFDFFSSACPRSASSCRAPSPLLTSSCLDPQSTGFSLEQFIEFLPQQLGRPVCIRSSRNQVLEYSGSNPAFLPPCGRRSHRGCHRKEFPMESPCHYSCCSIEDDRTCSTCNQESEHKYLASRCRRRLGLRVGVLD